MKSTAETYVPDGSSLETALRRTTHLGIGAHADDLEFMAWHGILECFQKPDLWFTGVTVTDGTGSSRTREYAHYSDPEMRQVRLKEQKRAAMIGDYSAVLCLDHPSSSVKDPGNQALQHDLDELLAQMQPEVVYTHNLADKHDTHVAVALRVVAALRRLEHPPRKLYGCEGWRGLDWMLDEDKATFDVGQHENVTMALMGVYDSQIAGGKRYDLATQGRKRANATYFAPRAADQSSAVEFAMDMTELLDDPKLDPEAFVLRLTRRFEQDVRERLRRFR